MEKFLLVMMVGLFSVTTSQANVKLTGKENAKVLLKRYRNAQPVQFLERGVRFFVYPNGEMNFNSPHVNYKRYRSHPNARYGSSNIERNRKRFFVSYDYYGNISRVGQTSVNYDRYGRVKRIGSVYISYNRFGDLRQVGDMRVQYSRLGTLIYADGQVKSGYCGICGSNSCSIDHFANDDRHNYWGNDYRDNDDDYDYYDDDGDDNYRKKRRKNKKRYKDDD